MTQKLNFIVAYIWFCVLTASTCDGSDSVRALRVGEEIWQVQYGVENGELSYLVFDGPKELPYENIVQLSGTSTFDPETQKGRAMQRSAVLHCPDGRRLELAGSGRIFLVSKGQISEIKFRISPKILEGFFESKPKLITLDTLKKFADSKTKESSLGEQGSAGQPR